MNNSISSNENKNLISWFDSFLPVGGGDSDDD
ncbi:g232 [Yersinia phage phiR1-37]|nr:hypothetical protein phiR1-37_gp232 [Yersinia phage phiR1-37]CCE26255.1 g232 [Yersinia phage phiR1-37]